MGTTETGVHLGEGCTRMGGVGMGERDGTRAAPEKVGGERGKGLGGHLGQGGNHGRAERAPGEAGWAPGGEGVHQDGGRRRDVTQHPNPHFQPSFQLFLSIY